MKHKKNAIQKIFSCNDRKWLIVGIAMGVMTLLCSSFTSVLMAQTVSPASISVDGSSSVCSGGSEEHEVSITLPESAVKDKVDVFFLFDDTGSFAGFVPTVTSIFSGVVSSLESSLPGVEFGFGVGRFEDYGGPGTGFSGEFSTGRPFTLNQPIITATDAGGSSARDTLINGALSRTAPGFGGDGPESAVAEGLYQIATGLGFDGDGNGSTLDSGPAGSSTTQTSPGTSGDVPAFSSNVAPTSGSLGGAGWRSDSLRIVILATDIASIAAFPADSPIPSTITGAGGSSEPASAFAASSTTAGSSRFGFVSDSKTSAGNTVAGAVVPAGAGTVQATIDALNALGIKVMGMGPSAGPTSSSGPSFDESVFLSALARLTGALDSGGDPLVFSTSVTSSTLAASIVDAISTTASEPVDITLDTTSLPAGLSFGFTPSEVLDVGPGGTAEFTVTLTGDGTPISGFFDILFKDEGSSATLGTIPVTVSCEPTIIDLVSFTAKAGENGDVVLSWETASEIDNAGFNIYRSKSRDGSYTKVNENLIAAKGNSTSGAAYSFVDSPGRGRFYYKLEDVDLNGISVMHDPIRVRSGTTAKR